MKGAWGHTLHVIKADEINMEKHTYPKTADLLSSSLLRNPFKSTYADTAMGQFPSHSEKK